MKIAFCLIGIIGAVEGKHGQGNPIDYRIGHHFHNKHIFEPNIKKGDEVLPWKKFNTNMAIAVEYDLNY